MKASKKIGVCVKDFFAQNAKGVVYITPANSDCLTTAFAAVRASIAKVKIAEALDHTTDNCIAVEISRLQLETLAGRREVGRITASPLTL